MLANRDQSLVVLVDLQAKMLPAIPDADEIVNRANFLAECAGLLGVPVLATTQNAPKLGAFTDRISLTSPAIDKMEFSCWGSEAFRNAVAESGRSEIIVAGVETHICIVQTCLDMLAAGYEITCVTDAVSARDQSRHKVGVKRLRDFGVTVSHSESVVYELMRTAEDPGFRSVVAKVIAAMKPGTQS